MLCKTTLDKIILWQREVNLLDRCKETKSIRKDSCRFTLSLCGNSNPPIQFGDKIDQVMKLRPKGLAALLPITLLSICALIMIFSLSINYTNLGPAIVLAQGSHQVSGNENSTIGNNLNNVTQLSTTLSSNGKNNTIQSSNQTENKDDYDNSTRLITLVTEDVEIDIAPGKRVTAWTFNGTVPGPTIRLAEGENVTIKYINKSPIPHTIHFHGNHDDVNDGVIPQVMPGETYLYNITGEPAGALMYHCHVV